MHPASARTHAEAGKLRVLVVDDDPATLELIRSVLDANGYECLTASNGEAALDLIHSRPGILIAISDINMPDMDGIFFLRRIGALASAPRVIFLTGYPRVDYAIAALRLGAVDFLTKPVRPRKLLVAVRNAMVRMQRERAVPPTPDQAAALAQQAEMLAMALKRWANAQSHAVSQQAAPASEPLPSQPEPSVRAEEFALLGMDHLRRLRRLFPPLDELDDIAWDLMREVLRAEKSSERLSVSGLSLSVEHVSSTTALRRIHDLVRAGYIVRSPDPNDARRDFVGISPGMRAVLEQYLDRVAKELAAAAGVSSF